MRWGLDRTDMAHDRDRWFTLLNAVSLTVLVLPIFFDRSLHINSNQLYYNDYHMYHLLTNCTIMTTVCTTCFVIKRYALRPQNVYTVSYDSHSKQRLLSRKY